jgi:hypothetical protein
MHRSLSFAMQRVCFQTKRSFPATNRAAEFALNNFGTHVVAADEERECVGSSRVAPLQQMRRAATPGCGLRASESRPAPLWKTRTPGTHRSAGQRLSQTRLEARPRIANRAAVVSLTV